MKPKYKTVRVRIKWAVMTDENYVSGPRGSIAWTYDRKEAEQIAKLMGGRVVDADKLASASWRARHARRLHGARRRDRMTSLYLPERCERWRPSGV